MKKLKTFASISKPYKQSNPVLLSVQHKESSFFKPVVQPKLTINSPDDSFEQEADTIADRIVNSPASNSHFFNPAAVPSTVQRKCSECEQEEKLQMKSNTSTAGAVVAPTAVYDTIGSGGQSMDDHTKSFMESRFGYDFSNVQIHNDSRAHQSSANINALAYTYKDHIVFGDGQYQPGTKAGKQLLAHELVHVLQQDNDQMVRRQPASPSSRPATSYIVVTAHGNHVGGEDVMQGVSDNEVDQKLSEECSESNVCWEGDYVGVELLFGTSPIPADGVSPRTIPPSISIKTLYKEAGGFSSYKYEGMDASPVWFSGGGLLTFNWLPATQTFFTYPLNKQGTLDIHIEMIDIEDDRLLVYKDRINFTKCNVITGCSENAMATNRWAVMPDNGGPVHPLTGSSDDGERYEIYKESGKDNYFICLSETSRMPVDRSGNPPMP